VTANPEHGAVPAPPLRERPAAGSGRRLARAAVVLVGAFLALALGAGPASAHADLVRSDPGNGTTVAQPPSVVRLFFSEEISERVSTARLVRGDGSTVDGTRVDVVTSADSPVLQLRVPRLAVGTYGVLWQVLATDDGHTTSGTVVFSVGSPSDATGLTMGTADSPQAPSVVLRWLRVALLAGLVGAVALVVGVLGPVGRRERGRRLAPAVGSARSRMLTLAATCAALSAVVGVLAVFDEVGRLTIGDAAWMSTARDLAGTRWAQLWFLREVLLVAAVAVLVALHRRARDAALSRAGVVAMTVVTSGLVWVEALGSHAASVDSQRTATVLADAVHVLAGCIWLGVLPALVVLLWPSPDDEAGGSGAALVRAGAGPLGRLLAGSVALVVVTGLFGAGRQVGTVDELVATSYGRTLLVKTVLLGALLVVGAVSASRLHGIRLPWTSASEAGGPRQVTARLVAVEAGVGAVLLLAVALLAETPPPRDRPATSPVAGATTSSAQVDDLVVSVSMSPGVPGPNGFSAVVASTRRPAPADVDAVLLELSSGGSSTSGVTSSVALRATGAESWFGTAPVVAGTARATLVVRRGGQTLRVPLSWTVEAAPSRVDVPPGHALAPYVDGLALLLVAGVGVVVVVHRRRSRGRTPTPSDDDALVGS
jgi:copper transport protein